MTVFDLDPKLKAAQAARVKELRAEASYHQRRADYNETQADTIEQRWGLAEVPATPATPEGSPAFESYAQYTPSVALLPPRED